MACDLHIGGKISDALITASISGYAVEGTNFSKRCSTLNSLSADPAGIVAAAEAVEHHIQ